MRTALCIDFGKIYKFMAKEQSIGLVADLARKFTYNERKSDWLEICTQKYQKSTHTALEGKSYKPRIPNTKKVNRYQKS